MLTVIIILISIIIYGIFSNLLESVIINKLNEFSFDPTYKRNALIGSVLSGFVILFLFIYSLKFYGFKEEKVPIFILLLFALIKSTLFINNQSRFNTFYRIGNLIGFGLCVVIYYTI